ncbi:hypothetical protein GCM10009786_12800 [Leucobacter alluvii]|uniref:DUF4352 domain-containing protein n=1 Tax=Leucobacter alluvii TaxID=340321 RepID=A0ABP5MW05_9MICO
MPQIRSQRRVRRDIAATIIASAIVAIGLLLVAATTLVTGAAETGRVGGRAVIGAAGADAFAVQVAGREGEGWEPTASDWVYARTSGFDVPMDLEQGFGPGASRVFTLGVRNASPELPGAISMEILNRDAAESALFDRLLYTVEMRGDVLLDRVPGDELDAMTPVNLGYFESEDAKTLTMTVTMPEDAGNELQRETARVQVAMRGVSQ